MVLESTVRRWRAEKESENYPESSRIDAGRVLILLPSPHEASQGDLGQGYTVKTNFYDLLTTYCAPSTLGVYEDKILSLKCTNQPRRQV